MNGKASNRRFVFLFAATVFVAASILAIKWTILALRRNAIGQRDFVRYQNAKGGLSCVKFTVKHHQPMPNDYSFPMIAADVAKDWEGMLTNGIFLDAPNPFPGLLPDGNYSRTLALPAGFNATNVPLIWRPLHYADQDQVIYLMWSGGELELIRKAEFQRIWEGLIRRGFPASLIKEYPEKR